LPSLTIENYVKTIYQACGRHDSSTAATGQIASLLGVSPGTVTSMLKTLKETGLAEYEPYEGVKLTEPGQALALRVLRRHRLIELFLATTLKLTWDEVHEEAENMEHAVSDLLVDRIDEFLGFPKSDPHGDPIPASDGTVVNPENKNLTEWASNSSFSLVRVLDQSPSFLRYLNEAGLQIGVKGRVIENNNDAGVISVEFSSGQITLAHDVAQKLLVASVE